MLFKTKEGNYVEIMRKNYTNDTAYYMAIMNAKGICKDAKGSTINEKDRIKYYLSP